MADNELLEDTELEDTELVDVVSKEKKPEETEAKDTGGGEEKEETHKGEHEHDCFGHAVTIPMEFFKFAAEKPVKAYAFACGAHCTMFLLFIILVATLGDAFLPFSTQVPLYIRSIRSMSRADAVVSAQEIANINPSLPPLQLEQSQTIRGGAVFGLEFIYEATNGYDICKPNNGKNIFAEKNIKEILEFEKYIIEQSGYDQYCQRSYPVAALNAQEAYKTNPTESNKQILLQYSDSSTPCSPIQSLLQYCIKMQPNQKNCSSIDAFPAGVLDCKFTETGQCEPQSINMNFTSQKLQDFSSVPVTQLSKSPLSIQMFYSYVASSFGTGNAIVPAFRTIVPFGLPLKGYVNSDDRYDEQLAKVESFLQTTYSKLLMDKKFSVIKYFWDGPGLQANFVQTELMSSGAWAVGSFFFVWIYMTLMTGSWWLSTMGMGQILLSFFSAYMLYFGVFQQRYFGSFNMLSVFIILGIGADDIFVFLDTYNQASLEIDSATRKKGKTAVFWKQMSIAWLKSSKAMLVTSFTTMCSFLTNATSLFPAVSTFGIFAAMLVFVNYMSVILFYPTVTAVYNEKFREKPFCCGFGKAIYKCIHCFFGEAPDVNQGQIQGSEVNQKKEKKEPEMGKIEQWFQQKYVPFVIKRKWVIIIVSLILIVGMFRQVLLLESDPDPPQMLPADNNYQMFRPTKAQYFARGGSLYSTQVYMAFGIDKSNPIDRTGTEPTDSKDIGKVNWDPAWSDNSYPVAKMANCIVEICQQTDMQNNDLDLGGVENNYQTDCMMRDFKMWVVQKYGLATWINATNLDYTSFNPLVTTWISENPKILEIYKQSFFAEPVGAGPEDIIFRLLINKVTLTSAYFVDYNYGVSLEKRWEAWFNMQLKKGSCKNNPVTQNGFQYSGSWNFFYVQEQMIREAFSGIAFSIGVAFCVLTLFTGNYIIAFYSTISISFIILCVVGFTVLRGWKLGVLEAINFVMVPGMSVDFVAHLAEGYMHSSESTREGRVTDMLVTVGVSVVSGAVSTMGASIFLFFPTILFFQKFGTFIMMTIVFSLYFSLFFFAALLAAFGPQRDTGNLASCCKGKDKK